MLNQLAEAQAQENGAIPIFGFVQQLIKYLEKRSFQEKLKDWFHRAGVIQNELRNWIGRVALEQGLKVTLEGKKEAYAVTPSDSAPYLLVILKPDDFSNRSFHVQAWLLNSEYKVITYLYADDQQKLLEDIPVLLDGLLTQAGFHLMEAMERLVVEFSLPRALMCYDVDHWMVNAGKYTPVKLGMRHRVVMRSLERAYNKELWPFWKSKWAHVQSHLRDSQSNQRNTAPFLICNAQDCERHEHLYAKLRVDDVFCLALTVAPTTPSGVSLIKETNVIDIVLDAGIPIAIWLRRHAHSAKKIQSMFETFLSCCVLAELPHIVWKQRLMATKDEDLGQSLALLWDDPDRLPPDVSSEAQFEAPLKKGHKP